MNKEPVTTTTIDVDYMCPECDHTGLIHKDVDVWDLMDKIGWPEEDWNETPDADLVAELVSRYESSPTDKLILTDELKAHGYTLKKG